MSDAPETTPTDAPVADPPKPVRRPFRKRHPWLTRLAVAAVVLLLILAAVLVAVQLVLTSDYPRTIAQDIASSQLGLDVKIGKLDIPWFAPIEIKDIAVSLPLAKEPFVKVPFAYAKHGFLPILAGKFLYDGDPSISEIGVRDPRVEVRQDAGGQWNVVRALDAVLAAQNKGGASGGGGLPPLPAIKLVGGTVHIAANTGAETTVDALEVNGEPDGSLRYDLGAGVPDRAVAHVNLVPKGDFYHEVDFDVDQIRSYVEPFVALPDPVKLAGRWEGRLANGGLAGRLTLDKAVVQAESARGTVDATVDAGGATVTVRDFYLDASPLIPEAIHVTAGKIVATPEQATADDLRVKLLGGDALVSGAKVDFAAPSGKVEIDYLGLAPQPGYALAGHLDAAFAQTGLGRFKVDATLDGVNTTPQGIVTTKFTLGGDGPSVKHLDLTAVVKQALFEKPPAAVADAAASARVPARVTTSPASPPTFPNAMPAPSTRPAFVPPEQLAAATAASAGSYNLPQITATFRTRFDDGQSLVALDSLETDNPAQLTGRGEYHPGGEQAGKGYLWLQAAGIPFDVPRVEGVRVSVDAGVNAWVAPYTTTAGKTGPLLVVKQFYASAGGIVVSGDGAFSSADPVPIHATASIVRIPPKQGESGLSKVISGELTATATVDGLIAPLKLDVTADVRAKNLEVLNRYNLSDLDLVLIGEADGERLTLHSETFELLGGRVTLRGVYPYRPTDAFVADADVRDVQLAQVGRLLPVRPDELTGTANGNIHVRATALALDQIDVTADFDAADIDTAPLKIADAAHVELKLADGKLTVDPLTATSGSGSVRATAFADLDDLSNVKLSAAIKQYPLEAKGLPVSIVIDGGADDLVANVGGARPEVNGTVNLNARVNVANVMDLADAKLKLTAAGRAVVMDALSVTSKIGGEVSGNGKFDLDRPDATELNVSWEGLDGKRLADLTSGAFPLVEGLTGTHSGHLTVAKATGRAAQGPLRIELFDDTSGAWREVDLGQSRLIAYYAYQPDDPATAGVNEANLFKLQKVVTGTARLKKDAQDRLVRGGDGQPEFEDQSIIRLAGGEVKPFFRLLDRPGPLVPRSNTERGPDVLSAQVNIDFRDLEIGALARSVKPGDATVEKVRGRLAGEVAVRGDLSNFTKMADLGALATLSGGGTLELSDADLKGLPVLNKVVSQAAEKQADEQRKKGKEVTSADAADPNAAGRGTVRFSLEGDALTVTNLDLFIAGVEIQGAPKVSNLSQLPQSELSGYVVAAARPLNAVKLPFFADADQILGALQQSAASFRLKGTLANLGVNSVEQASLAEAGDTLKEILTGKAAKQ